MKKGFTICEVLITIGIIGIIAEVTIPSLYRDVQEEILKTQFKKTFSTINQMASFIRKDNGGTLDGVFSDADIDDAITIITPYLNVVKSCSSSDKTCFPQAVYDFSGNKKSTGYAQALVLKDGSQIRVSGTAWVNSHCTDNATGTYNKCLGLVVDVNGSKGPNTYGKDIFYLRLLASRTVPVGIASDTSYSADCGAGSAGIGCGGWLMEGIDY